MITTGPKSSALCPSSSVVQCAYLPNPTACFQIPAEEKNFRDAGTGGGGGHGVRTPPHILACQITLSQPGRQILPAAHHITNRPPPQIVGPSDIPENQSLMLAKNRGQPPSSTSKTLSNLLIPEANFCYQETQWKMATLLKNPSKLHLSSVFNVIDV